MLYILAIILFLFVTFLVIPIYFSVKFSFPDQKNILIRIWKVVFILSVQENSGFFSILGLKFTLGNKKNKEQEEQKDQKNAYKETKLKPAKIIKSFFTIVSEDKFLKEWIKALCIFIKKMFKCIKLTKLNADIKVGLENPYETGKLMGIWYAVKETTQDFWPSNIYLEIAPDFTKKNMQGFIEINGTTSVIKILIPFVLLIKTAPIYRTYKLIQ